MRILHVISSGGMYGAEAVILNLSRTLNEHGHTSLLGIFSNSSNPNLQLHERALAEGIESHLISCRGQIDRTVPASIRSLAANTGADLIHAHGYKADVYVYLAMRETSIPLVSTCHTWYDDNRLVWLYGVIDRRVLRRYDAVVAVSEDVRQRLLGSNVAADKIHFIRNGIDLRPFTNAAASLRNMAANSDSLLVGWVGRLTRDKGPDLFLRAIAEVQYEFPAARYILAGEGPYRPEVESLITKLDLGGVVQLLGQQSNMPSVYASCDLMVSSSRQEGLPMAILEGMAASRPWVAASVGAIPLVVRNDQNGILIPPENVEILATSIAHLMRSAEERVRMGRVARSLTESEFSAERMSDNYLSVYKNVTAQNRNPGGRS